MNRGEDFHELTSLQERMLQEFNTERGYGEGLTRLYKRLQYKYGGKIHPGFLVDENGNQMGAEKEFETRNDGTYAEAPVLVNELGDNNMNGRRGSFRAWSPNLPSLGVQQVEPQQRLAVDDGNYRYRRDGKWYKVPIHEVRVAQGPGLAPIVYFTCHKLLPPRRAIQDFLGRDPHTQIDRQTRNNVAGGKRSPIKTSIKPVLPKRPLEMLFCDTMRMPECIHDANWDEDRLDKEYSLTDGKHPLLQGGVRRRSQGGAGDPRGFKWLFVVVDAYTKVIWVKEIFQRDKNNDDDGTRRQRPTPPKDEDDFGNDNDLPADRPQSQRTIEALMEFIKNVNLVRQHRGLDNDPEARRMDLEGNGIRLHPRLIVHDFGSEFKGEFQRVMNEKRGTFNTTVEQRREQGLPDDLPTGFYFETTTPGSRSHYNSMAERSVRTIRRYFYAMYNAYRRFLEPQPGEAREKQRPPNWPVPQQELDITEYDWVLDIPEVLRRYNSAYHTVIKARPIDVLLERTVRMTVLNRNFRRGDQDISRYSVQDVRVKDVAGSNIQRVADKRFRDVAHNLRLPGFSPSAAPVKGDFVRVKIYKSGDMSVKFPNDSGKVLHGKASSHNWSKVVYVIKKVAVVQAGDDGTPSGLVDGKTKYESPDGHLERRNDRRYLYRDTRDGMPRAYRVAPINNLEFPRQNMLSLDRTQILKIPPDTPYPDEENPG